MLSRNAERLMEVDRSVAMPDTMRAIQGQDILRGAMALLRRHYRRLEVRHSLDEARSEQAATTLVLDLWDMMTPPNGGWTVLITVVALDEAQMPVSRIESPEPAASAEPRDFRVAGIAALRDFERQINDLLR